MSQTIVIPDGDTTPRVTPAPEVRFVVEAGSRTETHGAPAVTLSEDATELLNAGEIATAGAPAVRVLGDRVRIENDGGELGSVVRVTAENLVPESGGVVAPLWFGFHDGGVDSFDEGAPASPGIANLSQDGITRREGTIESLIDVFLANGLDPAAVPPEDETIAGEFAASSGPGSVQGIVASLDSPLGLISGERESESGRRGHRERLARCQYRR